MEGGKEIRKEGGKEGRGKEGRKGIRKEGWKEGEEGRKELPKTFNRLRPCVNYIYQLL